MIRVSPDVVPVGAGIMSATLAVILKELDPRLNIEAYEVLGSEAQESSNAWNNAGTGHAALCELNYTPEPLTGAWTFPRPWRSTPSSISPASSGPIW
jgi:malate dehydrogenase (quinone)